MRNHAEAMSTFAQPLIDASDGSPEDIQWALSLSQVCWNLALLPAEKRDEFLAEMRPAMNLDDAEFEDFKANVVMPMVRRHQEMFPAMQRSSGKRPVRKYAGTGRNERCPCGSGKKYKMCCGR
jgi:hypothetical protein